MMKVEDSSMVMMMKVEDSSMMTMMMTKGETTLKAVWGLRCHRRR